MKREKAEAISASADLRSVDACFGFGASKSWRAAPLVAAAESVVPWKLETTSASMVASPYIIT